MLCCYKVSINQYFQKIPIFIQPHLKMGTGWGIGDNCIKCTFMLSRKLVCSIGSLCSQSSGLIKWESMWEISSMWIPQMFWGLYRWSAPWHMDRDHYGWCSPRIFKEQPLWAEPWRMGHVLVKVLMVAILSQKTITRRFRRISEVSSENHRWIEQLRLKLQEPKKWVWTFSVEILC